MHFRRGVPNFAAVFHSVLPKRFAPPLYFEVQQKKRLESVLPPARSPTPPHGLDAVSPVLVFCRLRKIRLRCPAVRQPNLPGSSIHPIARVRKRPEPLAECRQGQARAFHPCACPGNSGPHVLCRESGSLPSPILQVGPRSAVDTMARELRRRYAHPAKMHANPQDSLWNRD